MTFTSSRSLILLQRLRSSYLSLVVSIGSLLLAIVTALKELGLPLEHIPAIAATPGTRWLIIIALGLVGVVALSLRFPRIQIALLRLILGPPHPPANLPRLFRGPVPYESQDTEALYGRRADIEECWTNIQAEFFFILEGESGSGKSSILNAALIPIAKQRFRVIECRVADDPLGRLLVALNRELNHTPDSAVMSLATADEISHIFEKLAQDPLGYDEPPKPLLIFFDQFEELFATVSITRQLSFLNVLKQLVEAGICRVVVAIRNDFLDLLVKACHQIDPRSTTLKLGNSHFLRPFRAEQARAVLGEIFAPFGVDDVLMAQQLEDLSAVLVEQLLRPPHDTRLSRADKLTVLPVELQTVGLVLEGLGPSAFSAVRFRRLGGKLGLFRRFIEDAKIYTWRKTGVPGDESLLVLRKLISPSHTKWSKGPASIAEELGMPTVQVQTILTAFSEKYLVRRIVEDGGEPKYELMHEHLVQILTDVPDPILQKARDAEERLDFFIRKANSTRYVQANRNGSFLLRAVRNLFFQPVSVIDVLKLWRFASSADSRWILKCSLRGFCFRVLVIFLPALLLSLSWLLWIRSDAYQIRSVLRDAPVLQAETSFLTARLPDIDRQSSSLVEWAKALAKSDRLDAALDTLRRIEDAQSRAEASLKISAELYGWGRIQDSSRFLEEAIYANHQIVDDVKRSNSLVQTSKALRLMGRVAEANRALDEAYEASRHVSSQSVQLVQVAQSMIDVGRLPMANQIAREALNQESLTDLQALTRSSFGLTPLEQLISLLVRLRLPDEAKSVVTKAAHKLSKSSNGSEELEDPYPFVIVADLMIQLGMQREAKGVLSVALNRVSRMQNESNRYEISAKIAVAASNLGDIDMCLKSARLIEAEYSLIDGLGIVVRALTSTGRFDAAISAANFTIGEDDHARAISDIVQAMILAGKVDSAFATTSLVNGVSNRCEVLLALAKTLIKIGRGDIADRVFNETLTLALRIEDNINRSNQLLALASELNNAGQREKASIVLDHAVAAAENASNSLLDRRTIPRVPHIENLSEISARRRKRKQSVPPPPETETDPLSVPDPFYYLVRSLADAGRSKDVLPLVRKLHAPELKTSCLIALGEAFQNEGNIDDAKNAFSDALSSADQIHDPKQRGLELLRLAENEIELGQTNQAGQILRSASLALGQLQDEYHSFLVTASLIRALIQAGLIDDVIAVLQAERRNDLKYYALDHLIDEFHSLPHIDNKSVVLLRLLEVCSTINNDIRRSRLIAKIAEELARLHEFRAARLATAACSSPDRLGVYAVILTEHANSEQQKRKLASPSTSALR